VRNSAGGATLIDTDFDGADLVSVALAPTGSTARKFRQGEKSRPSDRGMTVNRLLWGG
jgi:hypothetical protein